MITNEYIEKIKLSINEGIPYDEYRVVFLEYIEFIKKTLEYNPRDIKAICQLAIAYMEAREPTEKSIDIMEDALKKLDGAFGSDEITELLTNLAYFYEEEMCEIEKAKHLLERAIRLNTRFPNPYNALGIIYLNENNYGEALKLFSKAISLEGNNKYKNNYAVALYQGGQLEQALNMFCEIGKGWKMDGVAEIAYYSYGMVKSILGDIDCGLTVADNLSSMLESTVTVDECRLAELYYLCKEYEKCIEMYDCEKLYYSKDWLGFYFYSHFKVSPKKKLEDVFKNIIGELDNGIKETQSDKDKDWSYEDRKVHIEGLKRDIKEFSTLYDSIANNGYIPVVQDFQPQLIYGCYLIDCPRHST